MRKQTFPLTIIQLIIIVSVLLIRGTSISTGLQAAEIMKLSEVKVGMKGEGRTIFKGTRIETFPFTVLGVVEKFVPGKNLIIVELDAPAFKDIGIIKGMSGSPAYIDGKLIGSISYGFSFSRKPIGGITPIEDILKTAEYNTPTVTIDISDIKIEFDKKNLAFISDYLQKELVRRINFSPGRAFAPIPLIGASRGFNPAALSPLNAIFSPFVPADSASSIQLSPSVSAPGDTGDTVNKGQFDAKSLSLDKDLLKLSPADAVSIPLISGDFEYSSLGTVTHVDGDRVFAFGHPYFNLGTVDFPLHKAEIISIVPSYQDSFKLFSTRNMVGRAVQDRFSAVQCELGKVPYMIPMNVFLKNRNHHFKIEMVNHPLLTPILAAVSLNNIFVSEYQEVGFQSIRVEGKIFIEGEKNIIIDDLYSGMNSFTDFTNLLLAINFFLMNNKEKNIKIQKLDFEISGLETVQISNIENVLIDKRSYLPGELINITVYLKNEKGKSFKEDLAVTAPNLKAGSDFYLFVADSDEMGKFDARNIRTNYFPIKLSFLIRAINNLRKNSRLYFKLMAPSQGLFIKGYEYPNLPSSLQDVFMHDESPIPNLISDVQSAIKFSTLTEYQMEFPSVVRGKKLFKLKIKERSDGQ